VRTEKLIKSRKGTWSWFEGTLLGASECKKFAELKTSRLNFFLVNGIHWVIGCANWRAANVLWASEVKETTEITRRGWMIVCFKKFEKHLYNPLSSSPIYSSFLVRFEWFKPWCVHQLELYKTSFTPEAKMQQSKILVLSFNDGGQG
jgi:hypothetical protein